jgi:hypothetical protein
MPEGWVARPLAAGELGIGPKGRVVMTLERRAAMPTLAALQQAVEAEGAQLLSFTDTAGLALRYGLDAGALGLLAVRPLDGGAALWCATTPEARAEELDAAAAACAAVRLEAP